MRIEEEIPIDDSMPEEKLMLIGTTRLTTRPTTRTGTRPSLFGCPIEQDEMEEWMALESEDLPWYADIVNYKVCEEIPADMDPYRKKKLLKDINGYYWDEPYLYKKGSDGLFRRCIAENEVEGVLGHCHGSAYGGHFATFKTAQKVLQAGLWWPTLFKDTHKFITKNVYILIAVDYVSKWVEAIVSPTNDHKVVLKLFKTIIFPRYGIPRVVISDGGTHFINKIFEGMLRKYGVKHKVCTAYHPQTSGQVEVSNKQIKAILSRIVGATRKDWSSKLDETLWAYRTAFKTPIGRTPFQIVYGKSCHLPIEVEYKALWAIKLLNLDLETAQAKRSLDLHELEEIKLEAYENSKIYMERTKAFHDKKILIKDIKPRDQALLYNSKLKLFPGKLKNGSEFTVNGQRVKKYLGEKETHEKCTMLLKDAPQGSKGA
ncbi:PREDICTED: uncharacterized protein LOC104773520 [Camelina sativa]|uniref:Uncharacterized protein LOC104773520 n=1 Tax=Camelina sativa TaxID=90675 RepID=A0ABM0Y6U5_CAMSA|nr:PREDICTED: uncharacterized protein LOC104773520 [Camelina sativa]